MPSPGRCDLKRSGWGSWVIVEFRRCSEATQSPGERQAWTLGGEPEGPGCTVWASGTRVMEEKPQHIQKPHFLQDSPPPLTEVATKQ